MIVPTHSLVAPPWSNRRSMVIPSPLKERFNVFSFMSVLLRERTGHDGIDHSQIQRDYLY